MRLALHAEWTKVRTLAASRWLLLSTIAATVAMSVAVTSVITCDATSCDHDTTKLSLSGVQLGQALVVILAVQLISDEYSSGMIRTTLTAMPHRVTTLAAKAIAATGVVAAAGTIAVLGSLLAGRLILSSRGYPTPSLADEPTLRASVGSILYLALIALLSLGVAAIVRDSATGIGVVLGLLYLVPIVAPVINNPHWQRLLQQIGPMSAGLAIQATTDLDDLPINPSAGLGILAAWAAAALLAGTLLLRRRDA
jgi:ABC-2 type transport system permease protein